MPLLMGLTKLECGQLKKQSKHDKLCIILILADNYLLMRTIVILVFLFMEQIYEVIIIGAGISGIGASQVLTRLQIPHIVL